MQQKSRARHRGRDINRRVAEYRQKQAACYDSYHPEHEPQQHRPDEPASALVEMGQPKQSC